MTTQTRLSAFKVLNGTAGISLVESRKGSKFPAEFCLLMAQNKINLLFLTCGNQNNGWGLNAVVDSRDSHKALKLIRKNFIQVIPHTVKNGILSLFPHRNNPSVTESLFQVLDMTGIKPDALAYSNSAISLVLREEAIDTVTSALFEPFQFSAYRTPADWKLAQKGKEQLFKEVVASYQEKRPKVYNLAWQKGQNFFRIELKKDDMRAMGTVFAGFARNGLLLPFLTSSASSTRESLDVYLCAPGAERNGCSALIHESLPEAMTTTIASVAVFCMNGPHFGDRYGIAGELLEALDHARIHVLALGCAVASISGVVPSDQIERATRAIQGCFEVPAVITLEGGSE